MIATISEQEQKGLQHFATRVSDSIAYKLNKYLNENVLKLIIN